MKQSLKLFCKAVLLSLPVLCSVPAHLFAESAATSVNVYNTSYETNMHVRTPGDAAPAAPENMGDLVRGATTFIKANVKTPETSNVILDLGHFDSEVVLQSGSGDEYTAVFNMSLRKTDGSVKTVTTELAIDPSADQLISEEAREKFKADFFSILDEDFADLSERYGDPFSEALDRFSEKYVSGEMEDLEDVLAKMIKDAIKALEPPVNVEPDPVWVKSAPCAAIQKPVYDPLRVQQEGYERNESLNFVEAEFDGQLMIVPQYEILTSFKLTVLLEGQPERLPVADVTYFVSIVPRPDGLYESTFEIRLVYGAEETEINVAAALKHGERINEPVFFPRWKQAFLEQLQKNILQDARSDAEKRDRILLISYLDPYMYEEYYDFEPLLVKAQLQFAHRSTQKELAKLIEEEAEAARKSEAGEK